MKAVVIHEYGGPDVLKFEDFPDPVAGAGEVLVQVEATSINPYDMLRRAGTVKAEAPIAFPGIVGADLSGTILELGPGVTGFSVGDRVFGIADRTYAERCVVSVSNLAKIPDGLDTVRAAALPLVTTTGGQLIFVGTDIQTGQTVLVAGAAGSVGRSAVFAAKSRGAIVIAGVRAKQLSDAASIGADRVVATDDETAMANLSPLDAVADAVGGKTAEMLIAKVKPGGVFASVLGAPQNAGAYPSVKVAPVFAKPDTALLLTMAQAVQRGDLIIPIGETLPLANASKGHTDISGGSVSGKVLLVA